MKPILILTLALSACALPGKPSTPQTIGECMSLRGDFGMSHTGLEGHETSYLALQSCQAQLEMRK